jgi:hypothetical protein
MADVVCTTQTTYGSYCARLAGLLTGSDSVVVFSDVPRAARSHAGRGLSPSRAVPASAAAGVARPPDVIPVQQFGVAPQRVLAAQRGLVAHPVRDPDRHLGPARLADPSLRAAVAASRGEAPDARTDSRSVRSIRPAGEPLRSCHRTRGVRSPARSTRRSCDPLGARVRTAVDCGCGGSSAGTWIALAAIVVAELVLWTWPASSRSSSPRSSASRIPVVGPGRASSPRS